MADHISATTRSEGDGLLSFKERVAAGFPEAVGAVATQLRIEVAHQLSTPGEGRYYGKMRQARGMGPEQVSTWKRRKAFNRTLGAIVFHLNHGAPTDIMGRAAKSIHRASKPGDPPAPDTGALKRSVFLERIAGGFIVGVAMAYARPLEFGTMTAGRGRRTVIAPRPFMRPALDIVQRKLGVTLTQTLKRFASTKGRTE